MYERPAARGRPTGSDDRTQGGRRSAGARNVEGLSRAQARALARSAPLTPAEFKARRRVAEAGISLRVLLDDDAGTAAEGDPAGS